MLGRSDGDKYCDVNETVTSERGESGGSCIVTVFVSCGCWGLTYHSSQCHGAMPAPSFSFCVLSCNWRSNSELDSKTQYLKPLQKHWISFQCRSACRAHIQLLDCWLKGDDKLRVWLITTWSLKQRASTLTNSVIKLSFKVYRNLPPALLCWLRVSTPGQQHPIGLIGREEGGQPQGQLQQLKVKRQEDSNWAERQQPQTVFPAATIVKLSLLHRRKYIWQIALYKVFLFSIWHWYTCIYSFIHHIVCYFHSCVFQIQIVILPMKTVALVQNMYTLHIYTVYNYGM